MEPMKQLSCITLLLMTLLGSITAQTEATESSAVNHLSTSTAVYILVGIAALYFSITLICLILIACTCYTNHKRAPRYRELKATSPISPLDTVPEKVDLGSQGSSNSFFTNSDDGNDEFADTRTEVLRLSTIYTNRGAFMPENQTNLQKHSESKIANYTPKMSPNPNTEDKALYSGTSSHLHSAPRSSPINRVPDLREQSPRFIRRAENLKQNEQVKPAGHLKPSPAAVTRVKSDTTPSRPESQKLDTPKTTPLSQVRSDSTPQRSPFRNRKAPRNEVAYTNTVGLYNPKKSLPQTTNTAFKPPEQPSPTKHKETHKPESQKLDTPKTTPLSQVRSDSTPQRSPFRNRKAPRNEVVYTSTVGLYNPKKSLPQTTNAVYKPPEQPSPTKHKETHKPVQHHNTQITLVKLIFELKPVSSKWKTIGAQLKIQPFVLNTINTVCKGRDRACLSRVCEEWMKDEKNCTWDDVVQVLWNVAEKKLAKSIHQKYCSGHLSISDSEGDEAKSSDEEDMHTVSWID